MKTSETSPGLVAPRPGWTESTVAPHEMMRQELDHFENCRSYLLRLLDEAELGMLIGVCA